MPTNLRPFFQGLLLLLIFCLPGCARYETTERSTTNSPTVAASPAKQANSHRILQDRPDRQVVQLANGLIIITQQVTSAPVVSVQCWVKTGSIYEQEFIGAGLSHFLEHLLAGGTTTNRSEEQTNQTLGKIGANTNAATSLDTVRYYIDTTSQHTQTAVELLSDWMQNALITQNEFDREREVIQNEFSMGDGEPGRIFWKLTQQARYQAHPARHPTIGYLDEFLQITPQQIRDFYHRMYVPNNMIFVVVGDIDPRKVGAQVTEIWQDAKPGELPKLSFPVEPELTIPRETSGVADVRRPRLRLAWPTTQLGTPDDYALDLLASVLGQSESSRLVQTVRNQKQSVVSISAYHASFHWGQGFFGIDADIALPTLPTQSADVQPNNTSANANSVDNLENALQQAIAKARSDMLTELQRVIDQGITPDELARAKRQTQVAVIMSGQTANGLAGRLAGDMIAMGDPDYLNTYLRAIESIMATDVQRVARHYLQAQRQMQITLLPKPQGQSMPRLTRPTDEVALDTLPHKPVQLDNAKLVERFEQRPTGGDVTSANVIREPVQMHTLGNGLRVILGRDTRLPIVAIQFFHVGGLLADAPGREGIAYATAEMLIKGTTTRSALQIANELDNLGASLDLAAGNNTWFARGVCLKDDWMRLLQIKADVILNPAFAADEWQRLQPRLLASIDRQNDSWSGELRLRFLQTYYPGHPWSVTPLGRREVVAELTSDDLRLFHHEHLDASQAALAIVGDIDPAVALAEVEKWLTPLPSRAIKQMMLRQPGQVESRVISHSTRKPVAAVQIGFGPGIQRTDDDYAAMQVVARVLSSFPTGWLDKALRGDGPGLVYAVGAGQATGLIPGYLSVLFNSSPAQVPMALQRVDEVIERLRREPIGEVDLQRAKAALLTDEFTGKQTIADLAGDAALNTVYGLPLDDSRLLLDKVEKLTAAAIQTVVQRRFASKVTVILSHEPVKLVP